MFETILEVVYGGRQYALTAMGEIYFLTSTQNIVANNSSFP